MTICIGTLSEAPLLAGLDQLLPWIHQWHPTLDKDFGETAGQSYQTMLEHDAHELGLTLDDIRSWKPESKPRNTRKTRKGDFFRVFRVFRGFCTRYD